MKTFVMFISIILLVSVAQAVDFPEVPRVSAYEAYVKYKAGKAIIMHAGGESFNRRHIVGAFNMDLKQPILDRLLPKFPKEGMEIFTYCY